MKAHKTEDILQYSPTPKHRSTVRRKYAEWRVRNGIPIRCDVEKCRFYTEPLIWLGKRLPLILDHISGNKLDDIPTNLRYLCPNCDSQLSTRGGANRGRVLKAEEGTFILLERDGKQHRYVIPEPARLRLTTNAPAVITRDRQKR